MLEEAGDGGDLRSDTTYTAASALLNADGRWKEVKEDSARRELLFDFQKALRRKVGGGKEWGGGSQGASESRRAAGLAGGGQRCVPEEALAARRAGRNGWWVGWGVGTRGTGALQGQQVGRGERWGCWLTSLSPVYMEILS
jgi:hypothetical protein